MCESVSCKSLHNQCLRALKPIILICPTQDIDPDDIFSLKESWYRLMLWDEPFHEQNLDEAMNRMPILRNIAIQFLRNIACLLLENVVPLLSVDPSCTYEGDLTAVTKALATDLKASRTPPHEYQKFNEHESDSDNDLDGQELHDHCTARTLTTTVQDISFYVSCLLGLQPAMESLSTFHLSPKEGATEVQGAMGRATKSRELSDRTMLDHNDSDSGLKDLAQCDTMPTIIVSKTVDESPQQHVPTSAGFPTPPPSPGRERPIMPLRRRLKHPIVKLEPGIQHAIFPKLPDEEYGHSTTLC
ncbi:hypothetical protein B0J14DRAFT_608888 [Halenospora varia]|nr:hypothetical protein B0J14DRAFT_608888 [Halenospora varia]